MSYSDTAQWDLIIYGGTSAGVIAAVQAARSGKRVLILEPGHRIGGMTTGGLSDTDAGIASSIGGLALDFYEAVGAYYNSDTPAWFFEPQVALRIFTRLLENEQIPVIYGAHHSVMQLLRRGSNIRSIRIGHHEYSGRIYLDATYEGDLLAAAGVTYTIGRESNSTYGETQNGIRTENELPAGIDPYVQPGNRASGLLERVQPFAGGNPGQGDSKLQAYNFRMCLTDNPANRVAVEKPAEYRESEYEILFRAIEAGQTRRFFKIRRLPNRKSDSNNDSGISTDYIGMNYDYLTADHAGRERIRQAHKTYQLGLIWTLQNHPRVPEEIRRFYSPWGLPQDEFVESGHWPDQLYVREGRRMISDYVITENTVLGEGKAHDSIGLGSYAMDSHHTQYCVGPDGFLRTEGGFYLPLESPYPVSYRAILPRTDECDNLLVPVCLSATHAAYGSIRMEPVFMILGQSAATAACLALDLNTPLSALPYSLLRDQLERDGQILECSQLAVV